MTATVAPRTWPLPPQAAAPAWRFGREVVVAPGDSAAGPVTALQWALRRNCSLTPRQVLGAYALLAAISLAVGAFFYWQGAPLVLAFAGLELAALGVALCAFARHAGDGEWLTLRGRSLCVELAVAERRERTEFATDWLRVEPVAGQGSLVELSGQGRRVCVGRHLRPELREAFAQELRRAVRRTCAATAP